MILSVRKSADKRMVRINDFKVLNLVMKEQFNPGENDLIIGAHEVKALPCLVNLISHEVLLFDQGLSNDRLLMTEGYLAHKWGIDDLITVSHPYKNNPPVFENRPEIY